MRRPLLIVLVVLTLLLLASGVLLLVQRAQPAATATPIPASTADVPRLDVAALHGQLATSSPPLVWDFRPVSSFAEGHIPASHVLTLDAIPDAAANLDRGQPIVTVCA